MGEGETLDNRRDGVLNWKRCMDIFLEVADDDVVEQCMNFIKQCRLLNYLHVSKIIYIATIQKYCIA